MNRVQLGKMQVPDSLWNFFAAISELIVDQATTPSAPPEHPVLEPASVFCLFARRMLVAFKMMSFEQFVDLFDTLELYRDVKNGSYSPTASPASLELYLHDRATDIQRKFILHFPHFFPSFVVLSRIINIRCFSQQLIRPLLPPPCLSLFLSLSLYPPPPPEMIGRVPYAETAEEIQHLLRVAPDLPQAHFLSYVNAFHHREFGAALDSLHRYFDYCAHTQAKEAELKQTATKSKNTRKPLMTQYAILNLALLHFGFGHESEALQAIHETVRIAQQNNDHYCLMHALALLCKLALARGQIQYASRLLQRCIESQAHVRNSKKRTSDRKDDSTRPERGNSLQPVPQIDALSWIDAARFQLQDASSVTGYTFPHDVWASLEQGMRVNTSMEISYHANSLSLLNSLSLSLSLCLFHTLTHPCVVFLFFLFYHPCSL
jgi:Anaphase-promoting complex subunit 5